MKIFRWAPAVALAMALLAGCTLWPSGWRIGGSPLDKNERAQKELTQAQSAAVSQAQAAVHKAGMALTYAPPEDRAVAVTKDFVAEAQSLLDQSKGTPAFGEQEEWRRLVAGLVSENAAIRSAAEKERANQAAATSDLAKQLGAAMAKAERADARALAYARDREDLADFAGKLKLGFFALIGLVALGTVLSLVARFVPQLSLASKVVNGIVAPGVTFAMHRAQEGLKRVGQGMQNLRKLAGPAAEDLIERSFDSVTDADHQAAISRGANS